MTARTTDAEVEVERELRRGPAHDDPRLGVWRAFLFAQSSVMPRLDADLRNHVGLSLAEFDTLLNLSFDRARRLRMSELAGRVLLSRSGISRMVDRLERDGYVRREACAPDGRGSYAVLTDEGLQRVQVALPAHLASVAEHFMDHVGTADEAAVIRVLGAVAGASGRPLPTDEASAAALDRAASTGGIEAD